jgi:hypothetical protein
MLSAQFATLQLMVWSMEMSAEEFVVHQDSFGGHQIIVVKPVLLLVLTVLELEQMTVTVA